MKFKTGLLFLLMFTTVICNLMAEKIGLLIMATGKYDVFVDPLVGSARKYFCPSHEVTFFVFSDGDRITKAEDVVCIFQGRLGWPFDTMMRNSVYYQNKDLLSEQDYLFAVDADMLFVDTVGDEILGERVATVHPGYVGIRGTYETDPHCLAYVREDEGQYYFAGGFFGGSREEFLKITFETTRRIQDDYSRGIIAVWHDESHWNRYCIDFKPTVILDSSYCCPDIYRFDRPAKLLCLTKNHAAFRD